MPSAVSARWPMDRFLSELASSEPAPGGGSAAALAGALGAGLIGMVCSVLLSRPRLPASQRKRIERDRKILREAIRRLQRLVREDALAYRNLVLAQQSGKDLMGCKRAALDCPIRICEAVTGAVWISKGVGRLTGPFLGSDLKAGQALMRGAFEAAWAMVEVNLRGENPKRIPPAIRRRLAALRGAMEG